MTFDQLLALETVIKSGSFKAAAARLHKTQPALSTAIRKLEDELQTILFDRSGYRPVLTPEGVIFYERAKATIAHMRSLQTFGEELALGTESELRIGVEGITPMQDLLQYFRDFFSIYRETSLSLTVDYLTGTTERLLEGELDFAFSPMFHKHERLESICITNVEMVPVIASSILKKGQSIASIVEKLPQVIVRDSGSKEPVERGVVSGTQRWRVSDLNTSKEIVVAGLGWASLPSYSIKKELKAKLLKKFEFGQIAKSSVRVFMIRNKEEPMGPVGTKLWDELARKFTKKNKSRT